MWKFKYHSGATLKGVHGDNTLMVGYIMSKFPGIKRVCAPVCVCACERQSEMCV